MILWSALDSNSIEETLRGLLPKHSGYAGLKNALARYRRIRELFKENVRIFSSGCIRIEKPIEFAEYLLRGNTKWTYEKVLSIIDSGVTMTVPLPEPIPIYLLYWTAWVEEDGSLHLRDDIYGRDKLLSNALQEIPPSP